MTWQQDAFWGGRLQVWQPARGQGYRFNLDPVLLAGFVGSAETVLELGAGCGILSLLLLAMGKARRVIAVERQADLAACCVRNAVANGFGDRMTVVQQDLREATLPRVDAVVFNPPYFPLGSGRGAPVSGRFEARHERHGTLADFVRTAFAHVDPAGWVAVIVPIARAPELAQLLGEQGGLARRQRAVHPRLGEPPNHVLIAASRQGESREEPPLIVHDDGTRNYTPEVSRWVEGPSGPS